MRQHYLWPWLWSFINSILLVATVSRNYLHPRGGGNTPNFRTTPPDLSPDNPLPISNGGVEWYSPENARILHDICQNNIFPFVCACGGGGGAKCPRPTVSYAYICNQKFYHKVKSLAPPYLPSSSSNWFLSHTPNRIHILCCFHEYLFHVNIQQKRTHMNILLKWQVGLFEPFFLNFAKTIFSTYANSFRTLLICVRDRGSLGQCKGMALHVRSYIGIAFAARIVKSKAV